MGVPAAGSAPTGQPQRLGLIAGLLALVAALCIGGFIAYKMMFASEPKEAPTTTAVPATDATSPPSVQPAEAPKDGSAAPAGTATTPDGSTASQATDSTSPATDAKSAGAAPNDASKAANANAPKASKAAAPAKSETPVTSAAPAAAAPPPPRQAAAPATPAAPQADHWELMRQAYDACAREGLLDRLSCNARVGRQYCEGYWGKVQQCPVGAYGDRGN
jgi:cytoskeletal protein RodZ